MVRWVVRSILHGVDPFSYISFQPVLHDWYNKGNGMCYHVCGIVHIKEPLLLIGMNSPCCGSGFLLSLSEWSFTICLMPYNRKIKCMSVVCKCLQTSYVSVLFYLFSFLFLYCLAAV